MSAVNTGGPAFPSLNAVMTGIDSDGHERFETEPSGGMTLRDYFAAKAMPSAIAQLHNPECDDQFIWMEDDETDSACVAVGLAAKYAYAMAGAMLEARK